MSQEEKSDADEQRQNEKEHIHPEELGEIDGKQDNENERDKAEHNSSDQGSLPGQDQYQQEQENRNVVHQQTQQFM